VLRLSIVRLFSCGLAAAALSVSVDATAQRAASKSEKSLQALAQSMRQARLAGDIEGCVKSANRALRLSPADTRIRGLRARCLAELERAVEALADLRRIEAIGPSRASVLGDMAVAYLALSRPEDAAAAARRAIAMDKSFEGAHFDLISALMVAGDHRQAIAAFEAFKASGVADRIGVANNLAWELYLAGRYADSLRIAEEWFAANPTVIATPNHIANAEGYAKVLDTAAHARAALGRKNEAVAAFMRAAALSPVELRPLYQQLLTAKGFASKPDDDGLERGLRACVALGERCRLYVDIRRSGPLASPR
jgi:tetratricopeptide (TPR) repeat protein